ncbi:MAG TPA: hypothetical protein VF221_03550 [Chloroflexota bacterium]
MNAVDEDERPPALPIPPVVIGLLLLLTVALAITFYVAAQVVHTP